MWNFVYEICSVSITELQFPYATSVSMHKDRTFEVNGTLDSPLCLLHSDAHTLYLYCIRSLCISVQESVYYDCCRWWMWMFCMCVRVVFVRNVVSACVFVRICAHINVAGWILRTSTIRLSFLWIKAHSYECVHLQMVGVSAIASESKVWSWTKMRSAHFTLSIHFPTGLVIIQKSSTDMEYISKKPNTIHLIGSFIKFNNVWLGSIQMTAL